MGKLHAVENRCGDLNLLVFTLAHIVVAVAVVVNFFFLKQANMNILFWEIHKNSCELKKLSGHSENIRNLSVTRTADVQVVETSHLLAKNDMFLGKR